MTINILQMSTLTSKNPSQSDISARSVMSKIFVLNRAWFPREHGHRAWFPREHGHINNGPWKDSYLED